MLVDPAPLSRPYRQAFEDEFARRQRSEAIREMREDLADSGLRDTDPDAWRQRQFELGVAPYFTQPQSAALPDAVPGDRQSAAIRVAQPW